MPKWNITVRFEAVGTYYGVEAESEEKARELAENAEGKCESLPEDLDLTDDSFTVIEVTEVDREE